ncbi:MAG: hypothetical protein ACD_79C01239G0003, partial [uncultured bacterium]
MLMKKIIKFLVLFSYSILSFAAEYYISPEGNDTNGDGSSLKPWATLNKAFTSMLGGDTLIVKDGIYTGDYNVIRQNRKPPNGSQESYTCIKAEHDGKVLFDGQNQCMMFNLNGAGPYQYIKFIGIKWGNTNVPSVGGPAVLTYNMNHVKFIRCGAFNGADGNAHSWDITYSSYILLEDCYGWGSGRYKFSAFFSDHIIFRRCVGRLDAINTTMPIAVFQNYCSQYVEFQNCIAIDGDSSYWINYSYNEGAYDTHPVLNGKYTENSCWQGCIALNIDGPFVNLSQDVNNLSFKNMVGWDLEEGVRGSIGNAVNVNHFSAGKFLEYGFYSWDGDFGVMDSIIYGMNGYGLRGVKFSNYNALYGNLAGDYYAGVIPGLNDFTLNNANTVDLLDGVPGKGIPSLKYLVRVEKGSDCSQAGSGGSDIGATIMTKIGTSETLYDEAGFNIDTGEALWPFPYETQIRSDMRTYNPDGTDTSKPDGLRGFCAEGQTLTNYIWGYLGNTVPPFNVKAQAGNKQVTLTWDPPAPISLQTITGFRIYDITNGTKTLIGTVNGNSTYTYTVTNLNNNQNYKFAVTVVDSAKGESGYSYEVVCSPICTPGKIYYVDGTNGNNNNDGLSMLQAKKAIMAGITLLEYPGDVLIVANGSYTEKILISASGNTSGYITIQAETDGGVVVDGQLTDWQDTLRITGDYVKIKGFKFIRGGRYNGFIDGTAEHTYIKNCSFIGANTGTFNSIYSEVFHNSGTNGLLEDCWFAGGGRYIINDQGGANNVYRRCVARWDYSG